MLLIITLIYNNGIEKVEACSQIKEFKNHDSEDSDAKTVGIEVYAETNRPHASKQGYCKRYLEIRCTYFPDLKRLLGFICQPPELDTKHNSDKFQTGSYRVVCLFKSYRPESLDCCNPKNK